MKTVRFHLQRPPEELRPGLNAIAADHPRRFGAGSASRALRFARFSEAPAGKSTASSDEAGITVRYSDRSSAFRMLGRLLALPPESLDRPLSLDEQPHLDMRGLMIDCSRNGVLTLEAARAFMRRVALMGVNLIMLYTEDTYEVPGEPFFGYLRGAYSPEELKALDDAADALGIELVPCIQTLGHLAQVLQWDAYSENRDTASVLLADDEATLELVRKMIRAASAPVRSRRIHIGMDEAMGVGAGQYRRRFGEREPFDILNDHLARVRDICREEGLRPMIWSDMYFRLGTGTHGYYDEDWTIPEQVLGAIPRDVQLVYWDYYHADPAVYRRMIANHRRLGAEPVVAGGIWTWNRFWCALPWSFTAVDACMRAVREEGLREVFMTLWGDNGMEVDIFSALPGIQFFCEQAYDAPDPMAAARSNFSAVCGSAFDDWVRAADIDSVPSLVRDPALSMANPSLALLWEDPLLALLDPLLDDKDLRPHYRRLAADLQAAAARGGLSRRLLFPARIARVLEKKAHFRRRLAAAYRAGNADELSRLAGPELTELLRALRGLWKSHRALWMSTYKPFGWEVVEGRYGALLARLRTVRDRVRDHLAGRLATIPELDVPLHNPWPGREGDFPILNSQRVKTPSCIK